MAGAMVFRNTLSWNEGKRCTSRIDDGPEMEVATPPQYKGPPGYWSPEEMLLASVNSCIMTTFLYFAERFGAPFAGYESEITGEVELVEGKLMFTRIAVRPRVWVADVSEKQKAQKALEKSEKYCLISNSIRSEISVRPAIEVTACT